MRRLRVPLGSQVGALRVVAQYLRIGWRMQRLRAAAGTRARAQRERGDRAIQGIHFEASWEELKRDQKKWLEPKWLRGINEVCFVLKQAGTSEVLGFLRILWEA